ncbi:NUDIX domain-containing protein [Aureliella helgolandensis]|uniref:GDP-mannose pyrophosphatase n=1 Tax=Aureliella helgolandensis TaxID=2527968 RepID=A0A518G0L1_9BACT|nr:NUDIX hydrolase [Aureliella helgolandensis]QDV22147.1 ADP-ribose pyrophosphatase [Aureliella helgolandensis]
MQKYGPWKIQHSSDVYADPWIRVQRDEVIRPDGAPGSYAVVHLKSGVCVIAVDQAGDVHLTQEFHYAVGRETIEGVSGGIEAGESPQVSAARELAEELGLEGAKWTHLGQVDPFTASIASTVDLYLAQDLSECVASPEGTELIEHVVVPMAEALQWVRDGRITHAPTCVALMRIALDSPHLC